MTMNRRTFLQVGAVTMAGGGIAATRVRAIAFDGLAVFDPRPIAALTEQLFPGRGTELTNAWRTRQFEYTWLRTVMNRYADFSQVTKEALVFSAAMLKLELTDAKRGALLQAFLELKAWPDAPKVLASLRDAGYRMALLSNFTAPMLQAAVKNSGLDGIFEPHLSTDLAGAYKPDPRAYRLALNAFAMERGEIAFAAFGGWDAAGAKAFGFPTYWANRLGLPPEELGARPDAIAANLEALPQFVKAAG